MSRLGLTYTDIRKKLNAANQPYGFLGSADDTHQTADVTESILEKEERVFGRLQGRYAELSRYVSGEWLCRGAIGDGTETSFTLGLKPATNVRLYVDFVGHWSERCPADRLTITTDYAIDLSTGVITLVTALTEGQTLIAEYNHSGLASCYLLRDIVKDLVAVEWARRLYPSDESFARYAEWERQAYSDLARLRKKDGEKLGIPLLDDLDLVNETLEPYSVSEEYNPDGGML